MATIAKGGDPPLDARSVHGIETHFTEIPLITIFAPVADRHLRLEGVLKPIGRNSLPLSSPASIQEQLPDARQIAGPHAKAGGEVSLAGAAGAPFSWTKPKRVEQDGTRIVMQRLFRAVLQNLPDQRGRAATINPSLARCRDNRLFQYITIGIGRSLHRGLPLRGSS